MRGDLLKPLTASSLCTKQKQEEKKPEQIIKDLSPEKV